MVAGTVNTIVGAGSLLTFPTLLFLGYPPLVANVSNTVGLVPGSFSGAVGYRRELAGQRARARPLVVAAGLGGVTGACLLLVLPAGAFARIVPVLILIACGLVAIQPRLSAWVLERRARSGVVHAGGGWMLVLGVFLTGIYGGYFGAAQGVILIALLAILVDDDLQRLNGLKNLIAVGHQRRGGGHLHPRGPGRLGAGDPARDRLDDRRPARRGRRPEALAVRSPSGDHHGRDVGGSAFAGRLSYQDRTKVPLTVERGRCMLAPMHRPITFGHGALVGTLSFAVLACTAAASRRRRSTPRPTPTPAPSVDVGAQLVKATVAAFASDPLVLHVAQTAKLT